MTALETVDENLWAASQPHSFMGLHLGTRMTVVRLPGEHGLWLHSPIRLTDALRTELDELGPVRHVVAPNLYHHCYAGDYAQAYEDATLYGAPGLADKRKDLSFDEVLGLDAPDAWSDVIEQQPIEGSMLGETVFFHRPSRSLIQCDVVENFSQCEHWPTRLYLKASGVFGRPGLPRALRLTYRDRARARECLDRVLGWGFDRIMVTHGDRIESDAKSILRETYTWL